ncbi:MAG: DUF1385 domain-containing protein [Bacteriovoracaceae bacterium]
MFNLIQKILLLVAKQYTSIGGQAVIEGVMMRSPNAFVVAVRKPDGSILLRRDQWYGLSKKLNIFKKPFVRGVLVLIESMANGIVSLNYSANIAQAAEDEKKGKSVERKKEKVDAATFLTIATSFVFGIALFVFLPHGITAWISSLKGQGFELNGFKFHFIDGVIKASIFILYIWLIGFLPDIKRVFQYHGAEHKSIATFEAGEKLIVENARKYTTLHPRCGTSFIFFLLFISIILFSVIFALIPVGVGQPPIIKHAMAMGLKVLFTIPIAGISYEIIRFAGKHAGNAVCKGISYPGMMLQKLTTKEPDDKQLEVALASIKAVLFLEDKFDLNQAKEKVLKVEEVEIKNLAEIEDTNSGLTDFLEA